MDSSEKDLLEAQLKRTVTKLFKDFLIIIEDVRQDHLQVIASMVSQFPPELVKEWNYLDMPRYSRIRKKILDAGNDSVREIQTILSNFQISLDNNKKV